jgi:hypothetical protein
MVPVLAFVKFTVRGALPDVGEPVKSATGGSSLDEELLFLDEEHEKHKPAAKHNTT